MVNGKQERLAKKRLLLSGTCDYCLCRVNNSHNCICSWWDFRYPDYWCYYMGDVFVGYCAIVNLELLILSSRLAWNCIHIMCISLYHVVFLLTFCSILLWCMCLFRGMLKLSLLRLIIGCRLLERIDENGVNIYWGIHDETGCYRSSFYCCRRGGDIKWKSNRLLCLLLRFWCSIKLMIGLV